MLFFIISVFTTLEWFNKVLRRNVYLKNITIIVNKVSIINCKFIIILFVAFLCLMMYPWFLNLFYRYGDCNRFDEKPADNCIHITGNFISKLSLFYFNLVLKYLRKIRLTLPFAITRSIFSVQKSNSTFCTSLQ